MSQSKLAVKPTCCGEDWKDQIQFISCNGTEGCVIPPEADFWKDKDLESNRFCVACFNKLKNRALNPTKFSKIKNLLRLSEDTVVCVKCNAIHHIVCAMCTLPSSKSPYTCRACSIDAPPGITLSAKNIPDCPLSIYLQNEMDKSLESSNSPKNIIVKVLSSCKRDLEFLPKFASFMAKSKVAYQSDSSFRSRLIMAFAEPGGESYDFVFFAMFVHEFVSGSSYGGNANRINLSYMDHVKLLDSSLYKLSVSQKIIQGYVGFVRTIGFRYFHIWACPPATKYDDYIFNSHPEGTKYLSVAKLRNWYGNALKDMESSPTIQNIHEHLVNVEEITSIPYFEGDVIPMKLEQLLRENEKDPQKITKKVIKSLVTCKSDIMVVDLGESANNVERLEEEEEEIDHGELFNVRENLISFCRLHKLEFSSVRRAQYSTMVLLHRWFNGSAAENQVLHDDNGGSTPVETEMPAPAKLPSTTIEGAVATLLTAVQSRVEQAKEDATTGLVGDSSVQRGSNLGGGPSSIFIIIQNQASANNDLLQTATVTPPPNAPMDVSSNPHPPAPPIQSNDANDCEPSSSTSTPRRRAKKRPATDEEREEMEQLANKIAKRRMDLCLPQKSCPGLSQATVSAWELVKDNPNYKYSTFMATKNVLEKWLMKVEEEEEQKKKKKKQASE